MLGKACSYGAESVPLAQGSSSPPQREPIPGAQVRVDKEIGVGNRTSEKTSVRYVFAISSLWREPLLSAYQASSSVALR